MLHTVNIEMRSNELSDTLRLLIKSKILRGSQVVLAALHIHKKSGVSPTQLRRLTKMSMPLISESTKALIADGLVVRNTLYRDQRSAKLYLTPKGKRSATKMQKLIESLAAHMSGPSL